MTSTAAALVEVVVYDIQNLSWLFYGSMRGQSRPMSNGRYFLAPLSLVSRILLNPQLLWCLSCLLLHFVLFRYILYFFVTYFLPPPFGGPPIVEPSSSTVMILYLLFYFICGCLFVTYFPPIGRPPIVAPSSSLLSLGESSIVPATFLPHFYYISATFLPYFYNTSTTFLPHFYNIFTAFLHF